MYKKINVLVVALVILLLGVSGPAMTKKILEDLGGTVEIESEPGRGTVVTLLLPPFLKLSPEEA